MRQQTHQVKKKYTHTYTYTRESRYCQELPSKIKWTAGPERQGRGEGECHALSDKQQQGYPTDPREDDAGLDSGGCGDKWTDLGYILQAVLRTCWWRVCEE